MALFRLGGDDHYCWNDHGPWWKWALRQGPNYFCREICRLREKHPDAPILELMMFAGPYGTWASQRPSDEEKNREILAKMRKDGRI